MKKVNKTTEEIYHQLYAKKDIQFIPLLIMCVVGGVTGLILIFMNDDYVVYGLILVAIFLFVAIVLIAVDNTNRQRQYDEFMKQFNDIDNKTKNSVNYKNRLQ